MQAPKMIEKKDAATHKVRGARGDKCREKSDGDSRPRGSEVRKGKGRRRARVCGKGKVKDSANDQEGNFYTVCTMRRLWRGGVIYGTKIIDRRTGRSPVRGITENGQGGQNKGARPKTRVTDTVRDSTKSSEEELARIYEERKECAQRKKNKMREELRENQRRWKEEEERKLKMIEEGKKRASEHKDEQKWKREWEAVRKLRERRWLEVKDAFTTDIIEERRQLLQRGLRREVEKFKEDYKTTLFERLKLEEEWERETEIKRMIEEMKTDLEKETEEEFLAKMAKERGYQQELELHYENEEKKRQEEEEALRKEWEEGKKERIIREAETRLRRTLGHVERQLITSVWKPNSRRQALMWLKVRWADWNEISYEEQSRRMRDCLLLNGIWHPWNREEEEQLEKLKEKERNSDSTSEEK